MLCSLFLNFSFGCDSDVVDCRNGEPDWPGFSRESMIKMFGIWKDNTAIPMLAERVDVNDGSLETSRAPERGMSPLDSGDEAIAVSRIPVVLEASDEIDSNPRMSISATKEDGAKDSATGNAEEGEDDPNFTSKTSDVVMTRTHTEDNIIGPLLDKWEALAEEPDVKEAEQDIFQSRMDSNAPTITDPALDEDIISLITEAVADKQTEDDSSSLDFSDKPESSTETAIERDNESEYHFDLSALEALAELEKVQWHSAGNNDKTGMLEDGNSTILSKEPAVEVHPGLSHDGLPQRQPPPRFVVSFVPKSSRKDRGNRDWQHAVCKRPLPYLPTNILTLSEAQRLPPKQLNVWASRLHSVTARARSALASSSAFWIGVIDGRYKNQVIIDALYEVWKSQLWWS